ncbi:MAG TPA: hypothetical protein VF246_00030 [Acidimicrobiia bacterium]
MVTPETPEPAAPGRSRLGAVLLGLAGVSAGVVALYTLTRPDTPPTAHPSTTTTAVSSTTTPSSSTTTIGFVPEGDPLVFEHVEVEGFPIAVLQNDAGELILVREPADRSDVDFLVSSDGLTWESLDTRLPEGSQVHGGTATASGLILHGHDASGAPTLWISEDGRSWIESVVDPDGGWYVAAVAAMPDLTYVLGYADATRSLDRILQRRVGNSDIGYQYFAAEGALPTHVVVQGPMAIPLAVYSLEELGIDPELWASNQPRARVSHDGIEWRAAQVPSEAGAESLFGRDGEVWAVGYGSFGPRLFSTTDGESWTDHGPTPSYLVQPWRGGLLTIVDDLQVAVSPDGRSGSRTSIHRFFVEPTHWFVSQAAAADGGIALLAEWFSIPGEGPTEEPETIEVGFQGMRFRVAPDTLTIFDSDGTVLASTPRMSTNLAPNLSFDPEQGEITFTSLSDGEPLVTLTLEDLAVLEAIVDERLGTPPVEEKTVLLTSPDACTWTAQELTLPDQGLHWIAIHGTRLLLMVGARSHQRSETQLWWADLPQGTATEC